MTRARAGAGDRDGDGRTDGDGDSDSGRRAGEGQGGAVGGDPLFEVGRDVRVVDELRGSAGWGTVNWESASALAPALASALALALALASALALLSTDWRDGGLKG
jgi:hypothetical protein